MVNLICGDLTAFAYTSLSSISQTSVNLSYALMCACLFLICMDHLKYIFPSLKTGK